MENSLLDVVVSGASIALTIAAIRWLVNAKGPAVPRTIDGVSSYQIKWQWRALGFIGGALPVAISIWAWHDPHSRRDVVWMIFAAVFVAIGFCLASGSVTTDRAGIAKRTLWSSRFFKWEDVTDIRFDKRDIGAIEIRSGSRKIVIDTRFEAFQYLVGEIQRHTQSLIHPK
jgi:hypothetical protein